jgi:hypothetical protein
VTSIEATFDFYAQAPGDGRYTRDISTFDRLCAERESRSAPEAIQTFSQLVCFDQKRGTKSRIVLYLVSIWRQTEALLGYGQSDSAHPSK